MVGCFAGLTAGNTVCVFVALGKAAVDVKAAVVRYMDNAIGSGTVHFGEASCRAAWVRYSGRGLLVLVLKYSACGEGQTAEVAVLAEVVGPAVGKVEGAGDTLAVNQLVLVARLR